MKLKLCLVFILQLCILELWCPFTQASDEHHNDYQSNAIPNHEATFEIEHKLLHECQHSDYRTYIKCLKREKRQHGALGNSKACLDECFLQNCTSPSCIRECHSHCRKRLIETYSKTWETSFDCTDHNCTESAKPNITANIRIENILPNCTETKKGSTPTTNTSGEEHNVTHVSVPKIDINNIINNRFDSGYPSSNCPCPGCYCAYNNVPQITIGITGGCFFPSWPCFQRYQPPPVDCSMCSNPFMRYQCNPMCSTDFQRNSTSMTTQKPAGSDFFRRSY